MSVRSSLLVALGWVAVGAGLWIAAAAVEVGQNLGGWQGRWTLGATIGLVVYLLALSISLKLHRRTRGPLAMTAAGLVTFAVAATVVTIFPCAAFEGRAVQSPLGYRVGTAIALALPALLLVLRRWPADDSDTWFRRHSARLVPLSSVLALVLLVGGLAGRRKHEPRAYIHAAEVLGGPSWVAELLETSAGLVRVPFALLEIVLNPTAPPKRATPEQEMAATLRARARQAEYRAAVERFAGSNEVPESIKREVREACIQSSSADPSQAHACIRQVLEDGRRRAQTWRARFTALALSAIPFGALALTFLWRSRRATARNHAR
jgi:hypothetical protein